jgi:endonuclease/exonuclease/phosphatase family metal-dependent hydrolase
VVKRVLASGAAAVLLAACAARTVNLLDPVSPKFEGRFAVPVMASESTGPGPIRVVSFNVKLADRIDATIGVLESGELRDADIIALQEMDETGVRRIAQALHLNYVYYPGSIHPTRQRYFGPAILSRWPIADTRKVILPHEGLVRHQRRNATAATVNVRGACVRVYAVHLETQLRASPRQREDQAAAVLADAATVSCPAIVAGDFNSWGIGRYFEQRGYAWPTERVGHTITIFSWDHIFARGFEPSASPAAGQVREVHGASDHHPVWATLVLPNRTRPEFSARR